METTKKDFQQTIDHQTSAIQVLTLFFCTITLAVIIVVSYTISMKISKPLTSLIKVSEFINRNASEKNLVNNLEEYIRDLPEVIF